MVHGPCGLLNPNAVCMKNGKCTKKYPFRNADVTTLAEDNAAGKLIYRRRQMPNNTILRNNGTVSVDNRWIVPHNLYLAAKYNAHINVEICTQINAIKYIYRYIYKGHNRAQVHMGNNDQQDEIKNFLDARYVSAAEACWTLLSFPMLKEYPACQLLDIHLPNDCIIYFDENNIPEEVLNCPITESTLTAWFKYNSSNPDDEEAKTTLYPNFCERYTFRVDTRLRFWAPRRAGFGGIIGRMYTVSPKDIEKYHSRLLLLHVPGATCFQYLKTFEGHVHASFQAAARARGLLTDDNEWSAAMTEVALSQHPSSLRQLFCLLIAFSGDMFDLLSCNRLVV